MNFSRLEDLLIPRFYSRLASNCPFRELVGAAALFELFNYKKRFTTNQYRKLGLSDQFFLNSDPVNEFKDSVGVYFYQASRKRPPKGELVLILPGMFYGTDHQLTQYFCTALSAHGLDVISFPSPFTDEFFCRRPIYSPGSFDEESNMVIQALRPLQDNYDKIHMIGASYGAFLGAVTYAISQNQEKPVFNGQLLLVNPVIKMAQSLELIDSLIQKKYSEFHYLKKPAGYMIANELHRESIRFQRRFVENHLANQATGFDDTYIGARGPHWNQVHQNVERLRHQIFEKSFEQNLTLSHALNNLTLENHKYLSDRRDETGFWLNRVPTDRVHIVATQNDPIVPFQDFFDETIGLPKRFDNPKTFIGLEFGSHGAFIVRPDLLQKTLKFFD